MISSNILKFNRRANHQSYVTNKDDANNMSPIRYYRMKLHIPPPQLTNLIVLFNTHSISSPLHHISIPLMFVKYKQEDFISNFDIHFGNKQYFLQPLVYLPLYEGRGAIVYCTKKSI